MPISWEWNRKTFLGNLATGCRIWKRYVSSNENWKNLCPSYDSHSVFLSMSETSSHLLRLGTWYFIRHFSEAYTVKCWLFDGLLCSRIEQKHCCTKCVWYSRALYQTSHFCNICQVNLFLFQWFVPVFLSSSSPKIDICSNKSNLHIFWFLRFVPVLWSIDKNSNKIIEPASNNYVVHSPAIY